MEDGNEKQRNKGEKRLTRVPDPCQSLTISPTVFTETFPLCRETLQEPTGAQHGSATSTLIQSTLWIQRRGKRNMLTIEPQHSHLVFIILFLFYSHYLKAADKEHKHEIPEIQINKMDATYSTCVKVKSCVGDDIGSFAVHICYSGSWI